MRRRAFNFLCLISLLIFLISIGVWARSYSATDELTWVSKASPSTVVKSAVHQMAYMAWTMKGAIAAQRVRWEYSVPLGNPVGWSYQRRPPEYAALSLRLGASVHLKLLGFEFSHLVQRDDSQSMTEQILMIPLWVFLLFGIPPLIWLRRRWKNRGQRFPVAAS